MRHGAKLLSSGTHALFPGGWCQTVIAGAAPDRTLYCVVRGMRVAAGSAIDRILRLAPSKIWKLSELPLGKFVHASDVECRFSSVPSG
ncbi:hypothetical protein D3C85_1010140 [compost metagenome]